MNENNATNNNNPEDATSNTTTNTNSGENNGGVGDSTHNGDSVKKPEDNTQAFAEIISEKDKKLDELAEEVKQLKKSNAEMLLRINSGQKDSFDFDKAVLSFDTRAIK